MGRIAGTPMADIARVSWKSRVAARREEKERWIRGFHVAPVADPPASRRQIALLWSMTEYSSLDCSMIIGQPGKPPLTRDMRKLIKRGLASLERRPIENFHQHENYRLNYLVITDAGRKLVAGTRVTEEEMAYVRKSKIR